MKTIIADLGHDSLKPLTYTRSGADLEVGGATVFEHIIRELESEDNSVIVPDYLQDLTEKNSELYGLERGVNTTPDGEFLLYNATVIPNQEIRDSVEELDTGEAIEYKGRFIAGISDTYYGFEELDAAIEEFDTYQVSEEPIILEYPWDLMKNNGELIERSFPGGEVNGDLSDEAHVIGDTENLYLGENAEIGPNATVDVSDGPVYIGENTRVGPNSRIEGPVYVGDDAKIGAGQNAVIHENTHIGDVARAGGELEDTIMSSFSNKYHYGFLGHAVVGSWVNFGAGTTNSDLKNTYGAVKVQHPVEGDVEAGLKIGATIADHTKTDIGTIIYTGKQIGPVAKIADTVVDDVKPFTWKIPSREEDYIPERAVEHAERMMGRRDEYLPEGYIEAQKAVLEHLSES